MPAQKREKLGRDQARRIALAAQGFGAGRPDRVIGMRDVQSVISRLGQFQIDSINVVRRAHYLPLYSRLGPYDIGLLDRAAHRAPRRLYEYWGHAASLIDVRLQPQLRFRMRDGYRDVWGGIERAARDNPKLVGWVRDQVAERGPLTAREIEYAEDRDKTNWGWNWSTVKTVLEWLFYCGEVTSARRNGQFERVYDLPERVFPASVLAVPDPTPEDSVRELVRHAARALGVASEPCLRDYFRTKSTLTRRAITDLMEAGELLPVRIEGPSTGSGNDRPHYLWHDARVPRRVEARALLSPFDSMIFERARLERFFDFTYRIEIYVPEPKRVYGYYVYPFLLGDRFVARVDLKADRAAGLLRVNSAWLEPDQDAPDVAAELATELRTLADWLDLADISVARKGDLAPALARSVGRAAVAS